MLDVLGVIIYISAFALFIIGLLTLIRDPKKAENRWFAATSFFLSLWIPANLISSNLVISEWSDFFLKVDLSTATFAAFALMMFVDALTLKFSTKNIKSNRLQSVGVAVGLVVNFALLALVFMGYIVTSGVRSDGYLEIHYSNLYYTYIAVIIFYFAHGLINLAYKKRHVAKEDRGAVRLIFNGFLVAIIANLLTNVAFPLFIEDTSLVKALNVIGYAGLIAMVLLIYVAITTKKLFDVRLIVARALAYTLLLSTLIAIYSLVVFGIANKLLGSESVIAQQVVPIIAAVVLVFTAPFFKKLFDRITNKFFYQDAYDPQELMDELNQVLISNMELSILLRRASEVIQKHIKTVRCVVAVRESEGRPLRIAGTEKMSLTVSGSAHFVHEMNKIHQPIIMTDELGGSHSKLRKVLRDADMALAVKMRSGVDGSENLAYLLLGPKQSGNMYGRRDIKTIEIIADSMVIAIQNALRFEEIQGFAATLQERVDEATVKLKRTNAKLKELDETKDEFISMASHQLRTPLTSVKGYLSMVLEGDMGKVDPKQKKLLDQAFTSSQRMVYLIADLLNVSRLKTGKFVIVPTPTDLAEMVQSEINQLVQAAKAKNINLAYKKPTKLTLLNIDETKMRQVVMNFADNAIYYTPGGGKVDIEIREDKNNVYFTVKDNGIGIPKDEQFKLFGKFFRATNAKSVRPDGTGLGLFMAKKVVSAQGGSIIFESEVGKGSTFGFCFSKAKLANKP